tara:strand:+ start:1438 stop:2571 length:1134 start_codon:yes stop_codon:yes gene_type:complete
MQPPRYLVCNGDVNSYRTHGGLPFNLFNAGLKEGIFQHAITLDYKKIRYLKYLWNISQFLKYRKLGGFQWSNLYSDCIFKQPNLPNNQNINIFSVYQLLPQYPWPKSWSVDYYIDATIHQLFTYYNLGSNLHKSYKERIIHREKINYLAAKNIICRSKWAINSLINDYHIDKRKIYFVPGGANIDSKKLEINNLSVVPPEPSELIPVILGFIGLDWARKGGSFLIELANLFIQNKIPLEIRVVGPKINNLPSHPSIKYVGFIDKFTETEKFINEVKSWHFGTLFSKAEAFGISNRECFIIGVPVICHDIGGISSTLPDSNFGKMFKANPSVSSVYKWIIDSLNPYKKYINLRKDLIKKNYEFTWSKSIKNIEKIINN